MVLLTPHGVGVPVAVREMIENANSTLFVLAEKHLVMPLDY